jgi:hypothetical protein
VGAIRQLSAVRGHTRLTERCPLPNKTLRVFIAVTATLYHPACVCAQDGCQRVFHNVNVTNRRASASVLAVSECQALETLGRDEMTASRTLTQVKANDDEFQRNQEELRADEQTQYPFPEFNVFSKLEGSRKSLLPFRATMRVHSRVSGQG